MTGRQTSPAEYIRHGQAPFFRLPLGAPSSYEGAGAVLLGVPYDGGVTYQPGARLGPYHVRRVSALFEDHHPVHRVNVLGWARAMDGGNVTASPFEMQTTEALVQREVGAVVDAGAVPFLVGGDHSIAAPALRAVAERHGPLAVVHIDAHDDLSGAEVWGGDAHHDGTPLRRALEEGLIEDGQLYQVGLRATGSREDAAQLARARGARQFAMEELDSRGVSSVVAEIRERLGGRPTYVTFDIDAVDPAFAPGTGTPVAGGLTSREAIALLRGLAGIALRGMDLVEVSPPLDHSDITCHLAAQLLYEGVALRARELATRA